jgi:hypothetical protein
VWCVRCSVMRGFSCELVSAHLSVEAFTSGLMRGPRRLSVGYTPISRRAVSQHQLNLYAIARTKPLLAARRAVGSLSVGFSPRLLCVGVLAISHTRSMLSSVAPMCVRVCVCVCVCVCGGGSLPSRPPHVGDTSLACVCYGGGGGGEREKEERQREIERRDRQREEREQARASERATERQRERESERAREREILSRWRMRIETAAN